jgi:phenylacetate-coenzyme A ligase PaaK-like adenylate-forming protein
MDIAASIIRNILFPLWMMRDGHPRLRRHLHYFDSVDHMSPRQLEDNQRTRLRNILRYAHANTEYYWHLFNEIKFSPDAPNWLPRFRQIPLLTKTLIKNNFDRLLARNAALDSLMQASTGGSTGVPLLFMYDKQCHYLRKGQELYFDRWMGYELGQKTALFVASAHFDGVTDRLKAKIRNATCERLLRFDPHHITDSYMQAFAKDYQAYKPRIIKCFPNSLVVFAEFVNRKGIHLPAVHTISCTGETLYDQQRQLFEKTFGGDVYEKYGTFECGVIACECRIHDGLHVFTEGVYLEILDEEGNEVKPGNMGRIVLTDLFNKGMPFIRYEIGDMGIAAGEDRCECGSPLPLIKKILGRDRDIIIDSYGNPKPGYLFVHAISQLDLPGQFQIVQVTPSCLVVKIAGAEPTAIDLTALQKKFQEIVGPKITIKFESTNTIHRDSSGKFRYVVSELRK